jgi:hypothetical protein
MFDGSQKRITVGGFRLYREESVAGLRRAMIGWIKDRAMTVQPR